MMLQSLDQWAFQVLFALYGFLGVADFPRVESRDWIVTERWSEQTDGTYRIALESDKVPEYCRSHESDTIVFQQIYMGKHDAYLDDRLVYTNSMDKVWNLNSIFSRPMISCRKLVNGRKLKMVSVAYIKYFASLASYPRIVKRTPLDSFLFNGLYVFALSFCLCLGFIGSILMFGKEAKLSIFFFFIQNVLFACVMFCYSAGEFLSVCIESLHALIFVSVWGGFYFFIYTLFFGDRKLARGLIIFIFTMIGLSPLYGQKNFNQLIIIIPIPIVFCIVVYAVIRIFRSYNYSVVEKIMYLVVICLGVMDAYVTVVSRNGVVHMSFLFIFLSSILFLRLMRKLQDKYASVLVVEEMLSAEKKLATKLGDVYEVYRQIIHDLKSPITSLNFLIRRETFNPELVEKINAQVSAILNRVENDRIKYIPDWYSSELLKINLYDILSVKKIILDDKIKFNVLFSNSLDNIQIYFDPVDLKIIFEELIDNSIKANLSETCEIGWVVAFNETMNHVTIKVVDNGPGLSAAVVSKIAEKGLSGTGSGLGLYNIKNRLKAWGCGIEFEAREGFSCQIYLKARVRG